MFYFDKSDQLMILHRQRIQDAVGIVYILQYIRQAKSMIAYYEVYSFASEKLIGKWVSVQKPISLENRLVKTKKTRSSAAATMTNIARGYYIVKRSLSKIK